ncbi:hypothetical protein WH43_00600 [Rheinheimera sp. KL1]|uniref:hypothetical protein n=1 Tax=Rheinheimera sp. KL1 TaxID=1635005 RepID=UPI0006A9D81D|nr:hypothetical protein [Rheinheimera sp. KL1]KOO60020.1 hypothetical protein WH43_00600 [Rheinheimera sp. KL1]
MQALSCIGMNFFCAVLARQGILQDIKNVKNRLELFLTASADPKGICRRAKCKKSPGTIFNSFSWPEGHLQESKM